MKMALRWVWMWNRGSLEGAVGMRVQGWGHGIWGWECTLMASGWGKAQDWGWDRNRFGAVGGRWARGWRQMELGIGLVLGLRMRWSRVRNGLGLGLALDVGYGSRLVMTCTVLLRVYRVRLGHHSMSPVYESGQQMFQGIKSIPHPGYSHPGHSNDLMLIKLNRKIRSTNAVKPIKIASTCPSAGTRCMVSGWGTTSNKQRE